MATTRFFSKAFGSQTFSTHQGFEVRNDNGTFVVVEDGVAVAGFSNDGMARHFAAVRSARNN